MVLLENIGEAAMLEQTAEECSELAQACLKLARKIRNENPTPKSVDEIKENLAEEAADVLICLEELAGTSYDAKRVDSWISAKEARIKERLGINVSTGNNC